MPPTRGYLNAWKPSVGKQKTTVSATGSPFTTNGSSGRLVSGSTDARRRGSSPIFHRSQTESNPYGIQTLLVERISPGQHRFIPDAYGRVHNAITSLHRTLRPALRIAGQPLGNVDIVNSQPALLAVLMHNTDSSIYDRHTFTPKVGVVGYNQLATSGRLYEHLMEWTGLSRREVKVGLLHACPASRRPALLFH